MEFMFADTALLRLAGRGASESRIEGDLPLPEGREASGTEVLGVSGRIVPGAPKLGADEATLEGRVKLALVCRDGGGELFSFAGEAPFRYTLPCPGAAEGMEAFAEAELLSVSVEPGARMRFCSTASFRVFAVDPRPIKALSEVRGVPAELERDKLSSVRETLIGEDTVRVREEVHSGPASAVVCASAAAEARSVRAGGSSAIVDSKAHVTLITLDKEGEVETPASDIPVSFELPLERAATGDVRAEIDVEFIEGSPTADGNSVSVEMGLRARIYSSETIEGLIPVDAYVPGASLAAAREDASFFLTGESRELRTSATERVYPPEGMPVPERAVWCSAHAEVADRRLENGTLTVEGVVTLKCSYISGGSCYSFETELPFAAESECRGEFDSALVKLTRESADCRVSGGAMALTYSLCAIATPYRIFDTAVVTGFGEREKVARRRALNIYYASGSETLFEVGKRFSIPRAAISGIAGVPGEQLSEGEALLFIG